MIARGNNPQALHTAVQTLLAGGLIGLPTETVYGLAANADDDTAVARIYALKGRPADHPLIVHVANASRVDHYASHVPTYARALMAAFWPGPLTLVLPRRPGVANAAAAHQPTIALRCPAHPIALQLLNWGQITINSAVSDDGIKLDSSVPNYLAATSFANKLSSDPNLWGLAAPSANRFGRVSPTAAEHVVQELGSDLLVLDGGACQVGIESAILDCTRADPVLLRPGVLTPAELSAACGLKVLQQSELSTQTVPAPKASGTLDSHYAPQARVIWLTAQELATPAPSCDALWSRQRPTAYTGAWLPMPVDAATAAQTLFATLRQLDALGVATIGVEAPPTTPDWAGVADRLRRAAHQR